MTINPPFSITGSCLFFFPYTSSASFHTFSCRLLARRSLTSAPPRASPLERWFLLVLSLSRLVMSSCVSVVVNSLCIHTRLRFRIPLPRPCLRPRVLPAVHSGLRCCRCITCLPTLRRSCVWLRDGGHARGPVLWGLLRARQRHQRYELLLGCSSMTFRTKWKGQSRARLDAGRWTLTPRLKVPC